MIPLFFFVCLHMSNRNQKPIEVLLKHGANINAKWNGKTVLDILNPNYHSDVIDYLKNNDL